MNPRYHLDWKIQTSSTKYWSWPRLSFLYSINLELQSENTGHHKPSINPWDGAFLYRITSYRMPKTICYTTWMNLCPNLASAHDSLKNRNLSAAGSQFGILSLTDSNWNWPKPSVAPGYTIVSCPPASTVPLLIYTGASLDWRLGRGSIYNTMKGYSTLFRTPGLELHMQLSVLLRTLPFFLGWGPYPSAWNTVTVF